MSRAREIAARDLAGKELIIDADNDTSMTADTDDQIDIRVAGSDQIKIAAGEVAFNEASGDIDFRVESNNETHALFIQGSDGALSMGASTPNNFSGFKCLTLGGASATTGSLLDLEDSDGNIDGRLSGENGGLLVGADPSDSTGSSEITFQVDGSEVATFNSAKDYKQVANSTGFVNFQGVGQVTIADDASVTLTSSSYTGGANHLFVFEASSGSNCFFYFGFNKSAIERNVEISGISFHNADQDGSTCLVNDGAHGNTLKNREGSSKTYNLLKVGVGGTANI